MVRNAHITVEGFHARSRYVNISGFCSLCALRMPIYHTNNESMLEMMSMGMHFFGEPFILIYLVDANGNIKHQLRSSVLWLGLWLDLG